MPRPLPLPPDLPRNFSVASARSAGVGYGRTRGADLVRPFHGIRSPAGERVPEFAEARARFLAVRYAPRLRDGHVFCSTTALAIHGLPVPRPRGESVVHVAAERNPPRARGVQGHQMAVERMLVDGLPVSQPVEAWVQSASLLSIDEAIIVGDALLRRRKPFADLASLEMAVAAARGARGVRTLVAALPLIRSRTDSPMETALRLLIVRAVLPEPAVNAPIRESGEFLGFGDLVYRDQRVIIEYEGGYHFESDGQVAADIDRIARFVRAGWRVIRVHKHHLFAPELVLADIRHALNL